MLAGERPRLDLGNGCLSMQRRMFVDPSTRSSTFEKKKGKQNRKFCPRQAERSNPIQSTETTLDRIGMDVLFLIPATIPVG